MIRDDIVPNAVDWFTGAAARDNGDGGDAVATARRGSPAAQPRAPARPPPPPRPDASGGSGGGDAENKAPPGGGAADAAACPSRPHAVAPNWRMAGVVNGREETLEVPVHSALHAQLCFAAMLACAPHITAPVSTSACGCGGPHDSSSGGQRRAAAGGAS